MIPLFWACLGYGTLLCAALYLAPPMIASWAETPAVNTLLPVIGVRLVRESLTVVPTSLVTRSVQFPFIALPTTPANLQAAGCGGPVDLGAGA